MNYRALFNATSLALQTILAHKTRAFLTVLGVVMGTGTIIGVGSILTGFDSTITSVIKSFGPNSIMITKIPLGMQANALRGEARTRKDFVYENVLDIREKCQACDRVSPMLMIRDSQILTVKYKGNDRSGINLMGVEEEYAHQGQVDMRSGRFFTNEEGRRRAAVAVIGADITNSLFPNVEAVGKWIDVNGHQFEVVGTMNRPAASFFGQDDVRVVIPFFTFQKNYPQTKDVTIIVNAKEGELTPAMDEARVILRIDRRLPYSKPDNFAMSTADQMVADFRQITSMVAIVMVVLSSIGLLVGGIGVMNIMLVSVTERTKEIGVRKAIGAKKSDIVLQFLIEAVALTGMGGLAGISFGWIVALLSRLIFPTLPTTVPLWTALLGLVVSSGTGLFFGIWPASKAARLDPVDALRYE